MKNNSNQAGKGDLPRPCKIAQYVENFEKIKWSSGNNSSCSSNLNKVN